jgi:CheY-like chemotaxis protein
MDYVMPDMTGIEAIRLIQKETLKEAPLFFVLSSTDRRMEISYSLKQGIEDYLMKPVKEEDLIKKIVSAIEIKIKRPDGNKIEKTENQSKVPNILIAEDQAVNQILVVTLLKRRGFKVTVAENGREVIHALKNDNFDLILMDVQMPEMDGMEATRIIRTSKSPSLNSEIPIIGVSAFAMEDDRRRCLEAGMNSHISKPIDKATLFNEIDLLIKKHDEI